MSFILWQIGQNNEPHEERVELIIVSFSEVLKEQRLDKGGFCGKWYIYGEKFRGFEKNSVKLIQVDIWLHLTCNMMWCKLWHWTETT